MCSLWWCSLCDDVQTFELCSYSRKWLHPSAGSSDVTSDTSSESNSHVLLSGDMLADAHHDVWRHAASHLIEELLVMTSRGATFRRLFLTGLICICWICDVMVPASSDISSVSRPKLDACAMTFFPRNLIFFKSKIFCFSLESSSVIYFNILLSGISPVALRQLAVDVSPTSSFVVRPVASFDCGGVL